MTVYGPKRSYDPFSCITTRDLAELRNWTCENCRLGVFYNGRWPEANHCLVPDRKRYHTQVTVLINLELVCNICHDIEEVHTFTHRVEFKRKQEERYGKEKVQGFLKSIPMVSDGIVEA